MPTLAIRTTRLSDLDPIVAAAGPGPGTESFRAELAGYLRAGPEAMSSLVAEAAGGRIAAHLAAIHIPMLVRGEARVFGRFFGAFVHPDYRLGGLHGVLVPLLDAFAEHFEGRDRLALVAGVFDETDWWWLRRVAGMEAIATGLRFERAPSGPRWAPEGMELLRFQAGALPEWTTPLPAGPCALPRDRSWAERRLELHPRDEIHCALRDGVVVGTAVVRDSPECRWLLDWAALDTDWPIVETLLAGIVGDGRLPVRTVAWNLSLWTAHALQEAGFRPSAEHEPYLVVRSSLPYLTRHFLAEHWQVFPDQAAPAPLPTLTAGDTIVTQPPLGTAPDRDAPSARA